MTELIKQHRGRVVDSPGDNVLAEFTSVVDAVQCAVSVQKELQARNVELPEERRMAFSIGVNLGDVIAVLAGAVVVVLLVIVALIWNFYLRFTTPVVEPASVERMAYPRPDKPSIAVAALDNLRKPYFG